MKLPRQLSPQARKLALTSTGQRHQCLLTIAPDADRERLRKELETLDVRLESAVTDHHLTLEIEDRRLVELARLRDVVQVELSSRLSRADEPKLD